MNRVVDYSRRTITYDLEPGDSPNLPWQYHQGDFRPIGVVVDLLDGVPEQVRVAGPAVTKSGKDHAWNGGEWKWRSGPAWPPEDAPDVALRAVADALGEPA